MPHRLTFKDVALAVDDLNKDLEAKGVRLAAERDGKGLMLVKYSGRVILSRNLTKKGALKSLEIIKGLDL